MLNRMIAAAVALACLSVPGVAEDKKDKEKDKPEVTTWTRETNGIDLKFEIAKDTLKVFVFSGENGAIVTCKMTADKDGGVKLKVTEVEEKGNFPTRPKVGAEVGFKWKVTGDTAELSDLTGEGTDAAKPVLEGEYKKKKAK